MKSQESKTPAVQAKRNGPFFNKRGGGGFFRGPVQAKLKIGEPNDVHEKEADTMADKVVQKKCAHCEAKERKMQEETGGGEHIQKKPIFESKAEVQEEGMVQRKCAACEAEQDHGATVEKDLHTSKGGGSPLPEGTRKKMEGSFHADFSGVRIHNDDTSARMNEALQAQAFTHKNDIYFNQGKFDTTTGSGQHLLAHELTHTVQQGAAEKKTPAKPGKGPGMGLGKAEQPVAPVEAKAKMDVVTQPFRGTSDLPLVVNGSDQRAMLQANPVIDGIKAAGADKKTDLPPAAQALVEEHGGKGKKKQTGKEAARK